MDDGGRGANVPFDLMIDLPQAPDLVADDADEPAVVGAVPAERLAAFEGGGEGEIRSLDYVWHVCYKGRGEP